MAGAAGSWEQLALRLSRAEQLLLAPGAEACEAAATELEEVERALRAAPKGGAGARLAAESLRERLRRVSRLLENAGELWRGWGRLLGALAGGYTASGEPAPLEPPASLNLEG
ncbi:MAG: hypothetical protein ACP5U2_01085 [Bryobacteraceae bacterium]